AEEVLHDKQKFMQDTQTFLEKFNRLSFEFTPRVLTIAWERIDKIKEELAEYINSPIWNYPIFFYDDDEEYTIQYREYLEKFPNAVTTVLPTEEPGYSLSMGYMYLSTTPETEFDKVTESSAKNLLPIPSECEVTSEDECECDMPAKDESFSVFTTFSNPLFDDNDDLTSSDDESLSKEEVPIEEFKVYPNLFSMMKKLILIRLIHISSIANLNLLSLYLIVTHYISRMEMLFTINLCPRLMEIANTIIESLSPSSIPVEDSDSLMDKIDLFLTTDELLPPNIESDGYDSEGDIHFLEELLVDDSISISKNEASDFDHDNPSFLRPPPEPPDVEFLFDLEPEVILAVMNNNDELNEDNCFDACGDIDVFANDEDDDYFSFMFVIRIFLSYIMYLEVFPLLLSAESEDTIFDPGISV
nr:hypothetical protein [Tanacetum cinerariifolium]